MCMVGKGKNDTNSDNVSVSYPMLKLAGVLPVASTKQGRRN